ncbi:MAG: amidohydrolase family protein [Sedimentisphaerales bacterium]|nr:amidohydrolase family protein [Sedimentisphaerales bacterium]
MFIDIHAHSYRDPAPRSAGQTVTITPDVLLGLYDKYEIDRGVLLPLVNPEVYLPQSTEEILAIVAEYGERLIPFCNVDPRAITNSADAPLGDVLRYYKDRGCKGIGEVMPNLPFTDPLVQNLFKHVEEVGMPLIFDISDRIGGDYGLYDDVGLPQLERCLQRFGKLKILGHGPAFWSEIGQLETPTDRAGYPKYPIKEEGVVPKLLRRYENMYGDLSAGSGFGALARDRKFAVEFLNEFQDKLLFGTDLCVAEGKVPLAGFLKELKAEGKLSAEAFEKIAWRNAAEMLDL